MILKLYYVKKKYVNEYTEKTRFKKGVFYDRFNLEIEDDVEQSTIYIYNTPNIGLRFKFNIKNKHEYLPYFYDYFYTEQEIRKIKLNEIQNS